MSDDDRDIDIESDEDFEGSGAASATQFMTQAEKRAHHNALERKRRDHIKDSFHNLRDSVPHLQGEKSSRAQILKQATDYIQFMTKKNGIVQTDIDDMKKQTNILEQQVRALEKAKATGSFAVQSTLHRGSPPLEPHCSHDESDSESSGSEHSSGGKRKRLKVHS